MNTTCYISFQLLAKTHTERYFILKLIDSQWKKGDVVKFDFRYNDCRHHKNYKID